MHVSVVVRVFAVVRVRASAIVCACVVEMVCVRMCVRVCIVWVRMFVCVQRCV